jgi:hypothetical protein
MKNAPAQDCDLARRRLNSCWPLKRLSPNCAAGSGAAARVPLRGASTVAKLSKDFVHPVGGIHFQWARSEKERASLLGGD